MEDPIDMTTAQGRAFATVLAVFAELGSGVDLGSRGRCARPPVAALAASSAARCRSATARSLTRTVRVWCSRKIPRRSRLLREEVRRALAGETVYCHHARPPAVRTRRSSASLRHPILAGMTPFNPGNAITDRGDDVLRGKDGLPIVNESLAIITPAQRRELLAILDHEDKPQRKPRASRQGTSPLLSRLVICDHCDALMMRGTRGKVGTLARAPPSIANSAIRASRLIKWPTISPNGCWPTGANTRLVS